MYNPDTVVLFSQGSPPSLDDVYDPLAHRYLHIKLSRLSQDYDGSGMVVAIMDTGILSHHPDLSPRLIESIDFTGEGPEDTVGHGTRVALFAVAYTPGIKLINVKILGQRHSKVEWLINALHWIERHPKIDIVNLSVGVIRPDCVGNCSACLAARQAATRGRKKVVAAAGNIPGVTACPAKASDAVFAVGAIDPLTNKLASYSGSATREGFYAPTPIIESFEWITVGD